MNHGPMKNKRCIYLFIYIESCIPYDTNLRKTFNNTRVKREEQIIRAF
jgi:hypothetical protein